MSETKGPELDGLLQADHATRAEVYTRALDPDTGWFPAEIEEGTSSWNRHALQGNLGGALGAPCTLIPRYACSWRTAS